MVAKRKVEPIYDFAPISTALVPRNCFIKIVTIGTKFKIFKILEDR